MQILKGTVNHCTAFNEAFYFSKTSEFSEQWHNIATMDLDKDMDMDTGTKLHMDTDRFPVAPESWC